MNLERTKQVIHSPIDVDNPIEGLVHILESAIELVLLPDNDFIWSYWENAKEASAEITSLISQIRNGVLPERVSISVIFAPTGPLQEVSLSSGWAEAFLKIAEKFDAVEKLIWPHG